MRSLCTLALTALLAAPIGAQEPTVLWMMAPSGYLPGVALLVRIEARHDDGTLARELWDAEAELHATPPEALDGPTSVRLWNGVGSALIQLQGAADVVLTATLGGLEVAKTLHSLAQEPEHAVAGAIEGPLTEWSGVIHVTDTVTVPAGATLRILPGTLVLVDGVATAEDQPGACRSRAETPGSCGKDLVVEGKLECVGMEDDPVVITAANIDAAWGEIRHASAAPSFYESTFVLRAGNSPRGGHTNTGPAIRASSSTIRFDECAIADTAGKSMQVSDSSLEFHNCLLTRSIMGPEIAGTALIFERSYSLELLGSDDNDGIYIHSQKDGQVVTLDGCVFARGDDDGIDTLGSDITVEDTIVRDFANPDEDAKGVSVFSGEVTVRRCLIARNKVGITAKSQNGGTALVHVDRTTIADCGELGIQAQDKFGEPDLRIRFDVTSSIIQAPDAVATDYPQFPDDIQIRYSDLSEDWDGDGNISTDPAFRAPSAGDYHLQATSPCIDHGEDALPPDPDGTRADMGAFPFTSGDSARFVRGRINEDASIDIADAVAGLLHLFAGRPIACEDAADTNDDGRTDVTDSIYLLEFLFRGGAAPPEPVTCGVDPTGDDGIECAAEVCG